MLAGWKETSLPINENNSTDNRMELNADHNNTTYTNISNSPEQRRK